MGKKRREYRYVEHASSVGVRILLMRALVTVGPLFYSLSFVNLRIKENFTVHVCVRDSLLIFVLFFDPRHVVKAYLMQKALMFEVHCEF